MKLYGCLYLKVLFWIIEEISMQEVDTTKHEAVLFIERVLIRMNDGI